MAKQRLTPALEAITAALQPRGKLTSCIQAGFERAIVNSEQAVALRTHILATVELCQSQAKELEELKTQLSQKQQLTIL